jgi:hypothetical protein
LVCASLDLSVWGAAAGRDLNTCPPFAYRFVELVGLPFVDGPGTARSGKQGCCWWALSQLV